MRYGSTTSTFYITPSSLRLSSAPVRSLWACRNPRGSRVARNAGPSTASTSVWQFPRRSVSARMFFQIPISFWKRVARFSACPSSTRRSPIPRHRSGSSRCAIPQCWMSFVGRMGCRRNSSLSSRERFNRARRMPASSQAKVPRSLFAPSRASGTRSHTS